MSRFLTIAVIQNGVKDPKQKCRVESHVTEPVSLEGDVIFREHIALRRVAEPGQGDASSVNGQVYIAVGNFKNSVSRFYIYSYT